MEQDDEEENKKEEREKVIMGSPSPPPPPPPPRWPGTSGLTKPSMHGIVALFHSDYRVILVRLNSSLSNLDAPDHRLSCEHTDTVPSQYCPPAGQSMHRWRIHCPRALSQQSYRCVGRRWKNEHWARWETILLIRRFLQTRRYTVFLRGFIDPNSRRRKRQSVSSWQNYLEIFLFAFQVRVELAFIHFFPNNKHYLWQDWGWSIKYSKRFVVFLFCCIDDKPAQAFIGSEWYIHETQSFRSNQELWYFLGQVDKFCQKEHSLNTFSTRKGLPEGVWVEQVITILCCQSQVDSSKQRWNWEARWQ